MNTKTTNTTAPLNVLAVMGRSFGIQLPAKHAARANAELREARDAVAELVAAAKRAHEMLALVGPIVGDQAAEIIRHYDGADCDGTCMADDCRDAAEGLEYCLAKFGDA